MNPKNNRNSETSGLSVNIRLGVLTIITAVIVFIAVSAVGAGKDSSVCEKDSLIRSDLINIDKMKIFGDLQEPSVQFYHDLHTETLEKENTDCSLCHKSVDNKLSPKFMRVTDDNKQEVMDIYHNNCIGCHEKTEEETGPVICRDCHTKKTADVSSRQPMGFDNSLHFRHTDSLENKCERCHHEYNKETDKLFYAKGKESSCRYCHKKEKVGKDTGFQNAAHSACIACHLTMVENKKTTGPVKCGGCHDLKQQELIRKVKPAPRINRKQPDFVMIKTGDETPDNPVTNRMNFVPFNHKGHEQSNNDCRVCHHKALNSCSSCHSVEGKNEGGYVNLENAMHNPAATQSCKGCHNIKKQDQACLGCHSFITENNKNDEISCTVCHVELPESMKGEEPDKAMAKDLLANRLVTSAMFTDADIPEKIIIGKLSQRYEATEFPHRKIVNTLMHDIKDNKLASIFHNEQGLVCKGCHHNIPITKKPSGCAVCHEVAMDKKGTVKPRLKGAYHIQCMECHDDMKIGKTGCTDCHIKKE